MFKMNCDTVVIKNFCTKYLLFIIIFLMKKGIKPRSRIYVFHWTRKFRSGQECLESGNIRTVRNNTEGDQQFTVDEIGLKIPYRAKSQSFCRAIFTKDKLVEMHCIPSLKSRFIPCDFQVASLEEETLRGERFENIPAVENSVRS